MPKNNSDYSPARGAGPKRGDRTSSGAGAPTKNNGRPGYASKRGDYAPVERGGSGERYDRAERAERAPRAASSDRAGSSDRAPRTDRADRPAFDRSGSSDRAPRSDRSERPAYDRGSRPERSDRNDRSDRPRGDKPATFERSNRPDRVARDNDRDQAFDGQRSRNATGKTFAGDKKLERLASSDASEVVSFATFQEMGLPDRLTQELAKMGAATPFPIQEATIPAAMAGRHVLGRGKTGSGKTIAFGVPLVAMLAAAGNQPRTPNRPRAVVLAPTRELAIQIDRTLAQLAKSVGFFTTTVYGGVPQRQQQIALNRGVDIVIATPGRLEDLIAQGIVDLRGVERIVVDEADHMCDLGFIEPVNRILAQTGESQKLLFSATLDAEVSALVRKFMPNPYVYEVPGEVEESSDIEHRVLVLEPSSRSAVFHRLVQGSGKSIVFVRTKQTAEALSQSLNESGVPTARLHGDLNQAQRTRNLERFIKGGARVMIATDVAARGIHVDDVRLVIQLDLPEEYKTYLHRAGRTGRAGRSGTVVSLVATGRTRKVEGLLQRADREAIYTRVSPGDPILEELAGPIAPPPVVDGLDFGDSRFDSVNKGAVKQELRDRHRPNKMGAAKDRRFRSR